MLEELGDFVCSMRLDNYLASKGNMHLVPKDCCCMSSPATAQQAASHHERKGKLL